MTRQKIYMFIVLIIAFSAFLILNFLTPLIGDDFAYLFKYGPPSVVRPTNVPIEQIVDIFESQYYHYLQVHGRFFSHFILQLVLFLGKPLFNILNASVFISLIYLIFQYSISSSCLGKNKYLLLPIIASLWFLSPFIGQTMLWLTGAVVYLWSVALVVLFLYYFKKEKHTKKSNLFLVFLFIISFFIGSTNESVTFGVAAALFFNAIFEFKKLTSPKWVMTIGFGFGVLAMVFAPGTFNRVNNQVVFDSLSVSFLILKIKDVIAIVYYLGIPFSITFIILLFLRIKKVPILKIIKKLKIIILAILFNCILIFLIGNVYERMLFGATTLIILLNTILFTECLKYISSRKLFIMSLFFFCCLGFSFYNALYQVKDYHKKTLIFENQLRNKNQKVFYFPEFNNSKFVYHTIGGTTDSKNYHNRVRGFYYGLSEVNILPEKIYEEIFNVGFLENEQKWATEWSKKLLFLHNDSIAVVKFPTDFTYLERVEIQVITLDSKEKNIAVNVIPIRNTYYGFINIDPKLMKELKSVSIRTSSGVVIEKIERSK